MKNKYPSKTCVNLIQKEQNGRKNAVTIIIFVVVLALIAVGCKFLVIDRLEAAAKEEAKARDAENRLNTLRTANGDYDSTLSEYQHYYSNKDLIDIKDILSLVEQNVLYKTDVKSIQRTGNALMIQATNISLEQASCILESLEASPLVKNATVATANSGNQAGGNLIFFSVILTAVDGGGEK